MVKQVDILDSVNQKYDGTASGLTSNRVQAAIDEMIALLESVPLAFAGTWEFDSSTVEGDPGPGQFRMNTGDYATTTEFYFDEETINGLNIPALAFPELVVGQRFICVQGKVDSPRVAIYEISAPAVDNTTYWTVFATHVEDGGGGFFQDGKNVSFNFWGLGGDPGLPEAPDDESRTYFREGTTPGWTKVLKGYGEAPQATLTSGSETLAVDDGNIVVSNLTGAYTLTALTASETNMSILWWLRHNGETVGFPASFVFPGATPPSPSGNTAWLLGVHTFDAGVSWIVTYVESYNP